jgi:hypothetical protein
MGEAADEFAIMRYQNITLRSGAETWSAGSKLLSNSKVGESVTEKQQNWRGGQGGMSHKRLDHASCAPESGLLLPNTSVNPSPGGLVLNLQSRSTITVYVHCFIREQVLADLHTTN